MCVYIYIYINYDVYTNATRTYLIYILLRNKPCVRARRRLSVYRLSNRVERGKNLVFPYNLYRVFARQVPDDFIIYRYTYIKRFYRRFIFFFGFFFNRLTYYGVYPSYTPIAWLTRESVLIFSSFVFLRYICNGCFPRWISACAPLQLPQCLFTTLSVSETWENGRQKNMYDNIIEKRFGQQSAAKYVILNRYFLNEYVEF